MNFEEKGKKLKHTGHTVKNTAKDDGAILLSEDTPFVIKEAYKSLRTNVMFSLPGVECKCVGITSAAPGEGKSTTAANLAISLAQIGKRVLLIDCDMRIPTVANRFHIKAAPGLSDFLVGQARVEDTVHQHESYGLNIMPSGNIPPDPTGLLEAKQLEHLFTAFRKIYEYVVIDLPPVTVVSDAVILSKYIDGFVLVAKEKSTEYRAVEEMLRQLNMADARVLGFVTTGGIANGKRKYRR